MFLSERNTFFQVSNALAITSAGSLVFASAGTRSVQNIGELLGLLCVFRRNYVIFRAVIRACGIICLFSAIIPASIFVAAISQFCDRISAQDLNEDLPSGCFAVIFNFQFHARRAADKR